MYEFILESTRIILNETTTLGTMDTEMTTYRDTQVQFVGIAAPNGLGLRREAIRNDKRTEANSIQINYLHFMTFFLAISTLP